MRGHGLEELETEFYTTAIDAVNLIPASDRQIFGRIRTNELAHRDFLRQTLGSQAAARPTFDFTGGNGSGAGPYRPFADYAQFLVLSQGFEDLGVRAYKGQAPSLVPVPTVLQAALTIHSVEARHASEVRRLRGERAGLREQAPYKGWVTLRQVDAAAAPIAPVYGPGAPATSFPPEENGVQAGAVNVATVAGVSLEAASESFDEPLDRATVLAIADPFIAG